MNSLLLAAGLTSCTVFSNWVLYHYQARMRTEVELPKAFIVVRQPKFTEIVDMAYGYPRGLSAAEVRSDALQQCQNKVASQ